MKFADCIDNENLKDILVYTTDSETHRSKNAHELDTYFDALEKSENTLISEEIKKAGTRLAMRTLESFKEEIKIPESSEAEGAVNFEKLTYSIQKILREGGRESYIENRNFCSAALRF